MKINRYKDTFGVKWSSDLSDKHVDILERAIPIMMDIIGLKRRDYHFIENAMMTAFTTQKDTGEPVIYIGYNGTFSVVEALAHEMVHAHQWERGDLRHYDDHLNFGGVDFFNAAEMIKENMGKLETYTQLPWEIEPYARQVHIASETLKKMDIPFHYDWLRYGKDNSLYRELIKFPSGIDP